MSKYKTNAELDQISKSRQHIHFWANNNRQAEIILDNVNSVAGLVDVGFIVGPLASGKQSAGKVRNAVSKIIDAKEGISQVVIIDFLQVKQVDIAFLKHFAELFDHKEKYARHKRFISITNIIGPAAKYLKEFIIMA